MTTKKKAQRGEMVMRALVRIDNGTGRAPTNAAGVVVGPPKHNEGEKGSYEVGEILPESLIEQLKKVDANGTDLNEGVLYEEGIASEEEVQQAQSMAAMASPAQTRAAEDRHFAKMNSESPDPADNVEDENMTPGLRDDLNAAKARQAAISGETRGGGNAPNMSPMVQPSAVPGTTQGPIQQPAGTDPKSGTQKGK